MVGKNQLYAKSALQPPPAKYACSCRTCPLSLQCEFASTFNVLTYMAAMSHVAGIIRRVSVTLGLRCLHSTLLLVLMEPHNLVTSAVLIEVIVFTLLYTCDLPLL